MFRLLDNAPFAGRCRWFGEEKILIGRIRFGKKGRLRFCLSARLRQAAGAMFGAQADEPHTPPSA